jgi:hypothetical protein
MITSKSVRVSGKGQTVNFVESLWYQDSTDAVHVLRVKIHNDSYRDQSWGKVERWDGTQWHEVASINGAEFSMELGIGYKPRTITAADFWQDRDHLLQLAQEVLLG